MKKIPVLVIHGGAIIDPKVELITTHKEYINSLHKALKAGYKILYKKGSALDAVETSIRLLEDNPLFNAGKGSAFTDSCENKMDAAIMDGQFLEAGAVAAVDSIKNPISAARIAMEKTQNVFLVGKSAEQIASSHGVEIVNPKYFYDERRYKRFLQVKEEQKKNKQIAKKGTVGAVAMDIDGNLAAGTSTGGYHTKPSGRIGDSPIIGAGTYANNTTCAISGTGYGEYFIRGVLAYDISALMEYKSLSLKEAAEEVIFKKQVKLWKNTTRKLLHNTEPKTGGIIGIDKDGNFTMTFNCPGMFRGYVDKTGNLNAYILK